MANFCNRIPDCDYHSSPVLHLFISCEASIYSTMASPPLENFDHVVVSDSIDFLSNPKWHALFHRIVYDYSHVGWGDAFDHLRDVPWGDIFKARGSHAASGFLEWLQIGIDVYIPPHCNYQVRLHSSTWFPAACAAAIVHRDNFFRFYKQNESSESKVKFRQAINYYKKVLEAVKLAYANRTKESITSQKLGSRDFWQIANSALNKG